MWRRFAVVILPLAVAIALSSVASAQQGVTVDGDNVRAI
jgi:hypothetical protein